MIERRYALCTSKDNVASFCTATAIREPIIDYIPVGSSEQIAEWEIFYQTTFYYLLVDPSNGQQVRTFKNIEDAQSWKLKILVSLAYKAGKDGSLRPEEDDVDIIMTDCEIPNEELNLRDWYYSVGKIYRSSVTQENGLVWK